MIHGFPTSRSKIGLKTPIIGKVGFQNKCEYLLDQNSEPEVRQDRSFCVMHKTYILVVMLLMATSGCREGVPYEKHILSKYICQITEKREILVNSLLRISKKYKYKITYGDITKGDSGIVYTLSKGEIETHVIILNNNQVNIVETGQYINGVGNIRFRGQRVSRV